MAEFIASRLRELRSRHGLTQEQTAGLLDADVRWYQRIELSVKDLRVSTVDRLAKIFGLTAIEFLAAEIPLTKVQSPAPTAPHKPRKAVKRPSTTISDAERPPRSGRSKS